MKIPASSTLGLKTPDKIFFKFADFWTIPSQIPWGGEGAGERL